MLLWFSSSTLKNRFCVLHNSVTRGQNYSRTRNRFKIRKPISSIGSHIYSGPKSLLTLLLESSACLFEVRGLGFGRELFHCDSGRLATAHLSMTIDDCPEIRITGNITRTAIVRTVRGVAAAVVLLAG
jgi:hypothetical protein